MSNTSYNSNTSNTVIPYHYQQYTSNASNNKKTINYSKTVITVMQVFPNTISNITEEASVTMTEINLLVKYKYVCFSNILKLNDQSA